jgi:hypothetical protein
MVEETITDGTRIAELFASELDGLEVGPLEAVSVVDADPDATPSTARTVAYGIAVDGERIGEVRIRPAAAVVVVEGGWDDSAAGDRDGLSLAAGDLVVERGAAVKRAVDALRGRLED